MNYQVYLKGKELKIFTAEIFPAPYNEKKVQEFVSFTFEEEAELKIISEEKIESAVIRPKSLGIKFGYDDKTISLKIDKPANFSVEINGKLIDNLLVFARPERENSLNYENVIKFEKGTHTIGKLKITEDNTLIYLEEGAYLDGKIEINNCKNIAVVGNGVISERNYHELAMRICFDVLASENVFIQDITVCDSFFWNMRIFSCDNVEIDNVKIIGGGPNNDAFDIVSSRNVTVKNCFTRTWDDSLVVKAFDDHDRTSPHVVFKGSDTDLEPAFEKAGNVENVRFYNCVLWNDFARPMELGVSMRADKIHDVVFQNIDVIHSTTGYPLIGAHHGDRADVFDVTFKDIRIEDAPGAQLFDFRITDSAWNFDNRKGKLHDFYFKDISWIDNPEFLPEKSRLEGYDSEHNISNFTFENISYCGKFATTVEEMNMVCLDYVDNVKVLCDEAKEKINIVRSQIEISDMKKAELDGKYNFKAKIKLENISGQEAGAKVWLAVSPVNVYCNDMVYEYKLKKGEKCEFCQDVTLPAGRYVLRVQSDNVNIISDWKLLILDWEIGRDDEMAVRYDFVNYYNTKSEGVALSYTDDSLIINSPILKNKENSLIIYTAMPVPVSDNEIMFSVEETDFGEAMAVEMGRNGEYVIAPQIRCPAEITYVFHNEPKVEKIFVTEIKGGEERVEIPFKKLGVEGDEFLIEIEAKIPEVEKYRYPYTLFHSVKPNEICHMFCKVIKGGCV